MAEVLKLADKEFKTTIINMLRALMDKVQGMKQWMGTINREMRMLRNNPKEMLELKKK